MELKLWFLLEKCLLEDTTTTSTPSTFESRETQYVNYYSKDRFKSLKR